jgi:hypothetical protein
MKVDPAVNSSGLHKLPRFNTRTSFANADCSHALREPGTDSMFST